MGKSEIGAFLPHLAVEEKAAASTQNQALSALLFLYRAVLEMFLDFSIEAVRAKRPRRLPTVLTKEEAFGALSCMSGQNQLIALLLYGSGLRLMECLRLRVQDIDFAQHQIMVRDGKGRSDEYLDQAIRTLLDLIRVYPFDENVVVMPNIRGKIFLLHHD